MAKAIGEVAALLAFLVAAIVVAPLALLWAGYFMFLLISNLKFLAPPVVGF